MSSEKYDFKELIYKIKPSNQKLLNTEKGHLIYMFPLFTNCLQSKEMEVRKILIKIFE